MGPKAQKAPLTKLTKKRKSEIPAEREVAAVRERDAVLRSKGSDGSDIDSDAYPKLQLRSVVAYKGSPCPGGLLKPDGSELTSASDDEAFSASDDDAAGASSSIKYTRPSSVSRKSGPKAKKELASAWYERQKRKAAEAVHALQETAVNVRVYNGASDKDARAAVAASGGINWELLSGSTPAKQPAKQPSAHKVCPGPFVIGLQSRWAVPKLETLNCEGTCEG